MDVFEDQMPRNLPEMRERRTETPDGRYLIYYELHGDGDEDRPSIPAANTGDATADV